MNTPLPTITFMGDRAGIQRVDALVTDAIADHAIIHVPRPMEGLASILAHKPIAIVLASDDVVWTAVTLRAVKAQMGTDFAVFVFTARPGAFNNLLAEFPNAKFIDGTTVAPLANWFTSGMLAEQLLAVITTQEPV